MKRITTIILIMFGCMAAYSQNLIVEYNMTLDIADKLKEIKNPVVRRIVKKELAKPIKFELKFSNGVSTYQQKQTDNSTDDDVAVTVQTDNSVLYKNQKAGLLIEQKEYKSRLFLIKEELPKYNWEVTNEKIKLGDYICTKALLKQDDTVTAWFTQDIPINEGPDDYYGLPGLIMKLVSKDRTFEVAKITPTKEALEIKEPTKGKKVTRKKFEKIQELKEKNEEKPKGGVTVEVQEY